MLFEINRPLTPAALYYAAVGLFLANGYTSDPENDKIQDTNLFPELDEIARVFRKDGKIHLLHYPGKDVEETVRDPKNVASPLSKIIGCAQRQCLNRRIIGIHKTHSFICESQRWRMHFVYASKSRAPSQTFTFQDSKKKVLFYPVEDGQGMVGFDNKFVGSTAIDHYGVQQGEWECGYYALFFLKHDLTGIGRLLKKDVPPSIDEVWISEFQKYFDMGVKHCSSQVKKEAIPSSPESNEDGFTAIDQDEQGNTGNTDNVAQFSSEATSETRSFFQRHRKTKYALVGVGVALAVVAAGVAAAFAWPVVLAGVGGVIAAHVVVGSLAVTTLGWLGIGAMSAALIAGATGFSLFVKAVKDKFSRKPAGLIEHSGGRAEPEPSQDKTTSSSLTGSSTGEMRKTLGGGTVLNQAGEGSSTNAPSTSTTPPSTPPTPPSSQAQPATSQERRDESSDDEDDIAKHSHGRKRIE